MFFRLSVFLFALTALSHFVVFATPMGLGASSSRWAVLDVDTKNRVDGHTPGGHVQPGTFLPAVQLTSSQSSNNGNDTSAEASPPSVDNNSNDESGTSDNTPDTNSNEESSGSDDTSESGPSSSSSSSPDTSTPPPSVKTSAALPANIPTVILPAIVIILFAGSGLL
ncbi:hypothetical protein Clacol_002056 [Clathrus columnatus]|uniref:Uncharacterized protein n=1 Tax=Clathrus columnatus TaxID=1419009 RepID=A0AAV5A4B0_9AGAM|nr:hypothetical protein Clacol_002056 [Clathrus columnatus]